MSLRDQQRDALRSTIDWAREIEEHLADARQRYLGDVHFRPAAEGVGMIGLRPDRPQRGKPGIRGLERLAKTFDETFNRYCVACEHGRATPEKELQSWLVAQAYKAGRSLEPLRHPSESLAPAFVTDEVVMRTEKGKRVGDLLALQGHRAAAIELKSERALKCLVEQVKVAAAYVDEHADLFSELYSVVLRRPISLEQPCAKWIVWPAAAGRVTEPREAQLAAQGIRVVSYTKETSGYRFVVGSPPRNSASRL